MTEPELIGYVLTFALTLVWSLTTFGRTKLIERTIFAFLSWIFWFVLSILHIGLFYSSGIVGEPLAFLWNGIGWVYFAYAIALSIASVNAHNEQKEWSLD